ncbi:unnamed protein product [Absidia cylindrospora]
MWVDYVANHKSRVYDSLLAGENLYQHQQPPSEEQTQKRKKTMQDNEFLKTVRASKNVIQNQAIMLPLFKNAMKLASDVLLDISFLVELLADDSMKTFGSPCKLMIEKIIPLSVIWNHYGQPLFCPADDLKPLLLKQRTQPAKERRLYDFLSESHLSFLFSHFFGKKSRSSSLKPESSQWLLNTHATELDLTKIPPGFNGIIYPHLTSFATNIKQMYACDRYDRISYLLNKTILILLRIHLAPQREMRSFQRMRTSSNKAPGVNIGDNKSCRQGILKQRLWRHEKRLKKMKSSNGKQNPARQRQEEFMINKIKMQMLTKGHQMEMECDQDDKMDIDMAEAHSEMKIRCKMILLWNRPVKT